MQQPTEVLRVKDELCQMGVLAAVAEYAFWGHSTYIEHERDRILREYGGVYNRRILAQIMNDYIELAQKMSRSKGMTTF